MNKYHELSVEKGWWQNCMGSTDGDAGEMNPDGTQVLIRGLVEDEIPKKLCLIHSEVSEALEDYRNNTMEYRLDDHGKPSGFASELADIMIRVYDLSGALGIDIDKVVQEKHDFNRNRPFRHGGKKA